MLWRFARTFIFNNEIRWLWGFARAFIFDNGFWRLSEWKSKVYARGYGLGSIRHKYSMLKIIEIQYLDLPLN
jgi:hypothetical protein